MSDDLAPIDWLKLPAAARKLRPGGSGGKGIDTDWKFCTPVSKQDSIVAAAADKVDRMVTPGHSKRLFETLSESKARKKIKVEASRSLIDNGSTLEFLSSVAVCRSCHSDLEFSLPAYCVTTIPTTTCTNASCEKGQNKLEATPTKTAITRGSQKTMTDYAINVLFVLPSLLVVMVVLKLHDSWACWLLQTHLQ